jgi:eukaryotic-like serine/threonine-protein kinase
MIEKTLNKILKNQSILSTDVGDFTYKKHIGEGGNAQVFLFEKNNDNSKEKFAIKFLKSDENTKIKRFKDEYFCTIQIPTHPNVARLYHFDKIYLEDSEYLIIIMKYYSAKLENPTENDDEKEEKSWKLFCDLARGLEHIHNYSIIHRDIKPQNIFYDEETNNYVLGDLGIAHFSDDKFVKEAKTKPAERLANYSFSAPEQVNSKEEITKAADIYSLGQVIQWY